MFLVFQMVGMKIILTKHAIYMERWIVCAFAWCFKSNQQTVNSRYLKVKVCFKLLVPENLPRDTSSLR